MTEPATTIEPTEPPVDPVDPVDPVTPQEPAKPTWNYAEGIPGTGETPEWFKADKYANIEMQAKAYRDLEGKLGSFTGSPEAYELNLAEELAEKGIEITTDDPLYEEAIKFAQESNMNQAGFDNMMNLYATAKIAEQTAIDEHRTKEMESLGPLGQERINNLVSWGKANLSVEMYEGFETMPKSAQAVKALEHIVSMTRSAPLTPEGNPSTGAVSEEELKAMMWEKDEHGNYKRQTDPEFKARYEKAKKEVWGTHDHAVVVGK